MIVIVATSNCKAKAAEDGKRQTNHHQVGHSGENNKKDEVNANSDRCVLCDGDR